MKTLTAFLQENPELRAKYVAVGSAIVDTAVGPLSRLMHHLLEVQGIDPRTQPGDRFRKALSDYMDKIEDAEEFEEGFDPVSAIPGFSPVARAFERAKGKLSALLSQEQYKKVTDLTHVADKPAPEWLKTTKVWEPPKDEHENALEELQQFMDKYNVSLTTVPVTKDQVKDSLEVLKKYADRLNTKKEKFSKARQPVVVGKTKKVKSNTKVTKSFGKNASFRRITEE
jgi:DNA repair ATPase RecN